MTHINRSAPVLVTGATGYVAGVLVKKLLENGLTVHAPVRNPNDNKKLKYLNQLAQSTPGNIIYFKADLMDNGSYEEAMQGCELVFHTASPFKLDVKNPQKDLVDPAQSGTRNVLTSANQVESVKRIVLTSSCAAIYGDNIDIRNTPKGIFTEDIWNTSSTLKHNAYSYSKMIAEKEAWEIEGKQSRWDLVVLNPALVVGPGINPNATSESFNMIKQMGDGSLRFGAPRLGIGVVDVRDLAQAHYQAGFTPTAKGRHIIAGHNTDMVEMAKTLLNKYGKDYPIPRTALPKWLLWIVGPLVDKSVTRKIVARNINLPWNGDNSKSIKELGIKYRPLKDSMEDFFQQMVDNRLLN